MTHDPSTPDSLEGALYQAGLTREAGAYLTLDQAAVVLHATRWQVYGAIRKHSLPHRKVGRAIVVRPQDVAPYLIQDVNTPA